MNDAELVRHLYHYDQETGEFLWRNAPAKAPISKTATGMSAGAIDKRDGSRHLKLGKRICRASRVAWLYVYGVWPTAQVLYRDPGLPIPGRDRLDNLRLSTEEEELTQQRVRELLDYDGDAGTIVWRIARKGVRAGSPAAALKNTSAKSAHLYVRINGVDYPSQRLIWFYVHGHWPTSRITFRDNDPKNLRYENLVESGFEHGTRQTPTISDEERKTRQAATFRRHDLKRHFDLTNDQYLEMHDAQNGRCAICGEPEKRTRNGRVRWLAVDHDHAGGGKIRELLCGDCNVVLGLMNDDPARLRAAAAYLDRHAAQDAEEAA